MAYAKSSGLKALRIKFEKKDKTHAIPTQKESLNNNEINRLADACDTFWKRFVVRTLLDTGLRLSRFANLKKDNIQWQETG